MTRPTSLFLFPTGIFKVLNLRVENIASLLKHQEATRVSKWSHSWKTHGRWCQQEFPPFPHQNQVIIPCCRIVILSIHFYLMNMHLEKLWRKRASLFDPFSMNGLRAGIHGPVWKTRDPTKQPSPQLNSQYPFLCHLPTSLPRALNRRTVRPI